MSLSILIIWFPIVVALVCAVLMFMDWCKTEQGKVKYMKFSAIWFYVVVAGVFLAWMFYHWYPQAFVATYPLCYFVIAFSPVAFYKLTCSITGKHFSSWHYLVPAIWSLGLLVWTSIIPFEIKLGIIEGYAKHNPDYPGFSIVFTSILAVLIVFSVVYTPLCIRNYFLYRKKAENQTQPYMLNWLKIVLILICWSIIVPIIVLLLGRKMGGILVMNVTAISISAVCVIMIVNMLKGNYPLQELRHITIHSKQTAVEPEIVPVAENIVHKVETTQTEKTGKNELSDFKKDIKRYFRTQKPYLNSNLKLEELAASLGYSRNKLSALINQAFKMNFNTFVNFWRLKEMENMLKKPHSAKTSQSELARQAGFGSYDSYLRAREAMPEKKRRKIINHQTKETNE